MADRRLWRCADADGNNRKANMGFAQSAIVQVLRRHRNLLSLDNAASKIHNKPYRQRCFACSGARIVAIDPSGRELPADEVGELWIHEFNREGYWNNPSATTESFTAGYWHSGDLGFVDKDGFVRVFDRAKDMINRGGLKLFSAEVESAQLSLKPVRCSANVCMQL